ncbi:DUF6325 family protein [Actinoplanes sp. NPDC026623]|uniref:DUF6325 family protein n=1 Tax=Actinoplanes sp. NPDC026623 TaxID=3155610 RepID=UPI0033DEFCAA
MPPQEIGDGYVMALGPVELIILTFPAADLKDGVRAALDQLTELDHLRVVDVLVIRTDAAGRACSMEIDDVPGLAEGRAGFSGLPSGLITETDVDDVAALVDFGTDALAVLVQLLWVNDLAGLVATANGSVVALTPVHTVHAVPPRSLAAVDGG